MILRLRLWERSLFVHQGLISRCVYFFRPTLPAFVFNGCFLNVIDLRVFIRFRLWILPDEAFEGSSRSIAALSTGSDLGASNRRWAG